MIADSSQGHSKSSSWSLKTTEKILSVQRFYLLLFGLLVPGKWTVRVPNICLNACSALAALFLIATWINFILNACSFWGQLFPRVRNDTEIDDLYQAFKGAKNAGIMMSLAIAPESLTTLRSALVLTFLFLQRRKWKDLYVKITKIITENLPEAKQDRYLLLWSRWSTAHIFVVLVLYSGNPIIYWLTVYLEIGPSAMYTTTNNYYPLPFKLTLWQEFSRSVTLMTPVGIISQVAYSTLVVFAKLLSESIKLFNHEIVKERDRIMIKTVNIPEKRNFPVDFVVCHTNILEFARRHESLCEFCDELNDFAGNVLFLMWGLDALSAMSCLGNIVIARQPDISSVFSNYYGFVSYLSSAVLLLFPIVAVHEQGEQTSVNLHRLSRALGSVLDFDCVQAGQKQVDRELLRLLMASRDRQLVIQGAQFVHFTRTFFATNLTLAISFGLVAQEFLTV